MIELLTEISDPQYEHFESLWIKEECYRFYVKYRKINCTVNELMDLWLRVPYCQICARSDPFIRNSDPEITSNNWEQDMQFVLGEETTEKVITEFTNNPNYSMLCKKCMTELKPWQQDDVFVAKYHLEEHYDIPLESPKKDPEKKLRNQIISLYDKKCFGCNCIESKLSIDHVFPRSKGGTAAFRNLQPLCIDCGNKKADKLPDEVTVYSDIYFGPYPQDSFEGLFW